MLVDATGRLRRLTETPLDVQVQFATQLVGSSRHLTE